MFEKEAEEFKKQIQQEYLDLWKNGAYPPLWERIGELWEKGSEFGYNKAKEEDKWHYVKDGDLPKENEYIMIYSKLADNIAVGKRRCAGKIRKRCVYEWYFATYEGTYRLRDKDIIAWKEIVFPELPKEMRS